MDSTSGNPKDMQSPNSNRKLVMPPTVSTSPTFAPHAASVRNKHLQPIVPLIQGSVRRTTHRLCHGDHSLVPLPTFRSPSPTANAAASAVHAAAWLTGSRTVSPVLLPLTAPIVTATDPSGLELIAATTVNLASAPTAGTAASATIDHDLLATAPPSSRLSGNAITAEDIAEQIGYELQLLSKQGVSPSQHLINLCRLGQWQTVQNLLTYVDWGLFDRNVVSSGTGWTPIMFAAKENRVHIVEMMLKMGFDINSRAKVSSCLILFKYF
jgi:hypothetical protein